MDKDSAKPRKVWLHRISHEAEMSYPLLERGYLTTGFSDFSTHENLDSWRRPDGWSELEKEMMAQ